MKKCKVYEESKKCEISPEKTKAILSELEDSLHRMADRVDVDEDDGTIKIEGMKGKLCQISGTLRITDKKERYILDGEIEAKQDGVFWGIFAVGCVLFLISIFTLWPLALVSIIIDVVLLVMFLNSVKNTSKMLGDKFIDAVKNT